VAACNGNNGEEERTDERTYERTEKRTGLPGKTNRDAKTAKDPPLQGDVK